MAPATATRAKHDGTITCELCGTSFSLRAATDEMERLRTGVGKWLAELAAESVVSTDDESRHHVFVERLAPALQFDVDHAIAPFAARRHGALFAFPIANELPQSPFMEANRAMPDSVTLVERLKTIEARATSPEVLAFAVTEADRAAIQLIQTTCQESVRLAAARRHALSFDVDSLRKCVANLDALREGYDQLQRSSAQDPARRHFSRALARRISAVIAATSAVQTLLNTRGAHQPITFAASFASAFESAASACDVAAADLEDAGVDPRESTPAAEGTRIDAQTMRIVRDCVRLWGSCGAERGHPFEELVRSLANLVSRAREKHSGLGWLSSFLVQLSTHVSATQGEPLVALVTDHGAAEAEAHANARSGIFAGADSVTIGARLMIPFWVAELTFTQQTGVIFKKGRSAQELVFLEAASHSGNWFRANTDSDVGRAASNAFMERGALPRSTEPLLPVVGLDAAVARFKSIIQATPGYTGGRPKMHGLVYLPAVRASFANREGRRDATLVVGAGLQFANMEPKPVRFGTFDLKLA